MLPEVQIKKLLDFFINKIDEDYLFCIFDGLFLDDYDFFENAKSIFLKNIESSRQIETHIFFNHNRANLPTIHINLPAESMSGDNGVDWGQELVDENCGNNVLQSTTRAYSSKFNLIFTSSNTFEVLIMYYTIKSLIQGNIEVLELNHIRNPKLSGNDIIFNENFMPQDIYSRALSIDCIYDFKGLSINRVEPISKVIFKGEML